MKTVSREEYLYIIEKATRDFNEANDTAFGALNRIQVCRVNEDFGSSKEPAIFGVNWAAIGEVDYEVAENYAEELMLAARLARKLTAMQITYDYNIDGREFYKKIVELRREA